MAFIRGTAADDTLTGTIGNDKLEAAGGDDVVVFSGNAGDYRFGYSNGYLSVTDINLLDGNEGSDLLRSMFVPAAIDALLQRHRDGSANHTRELRALAALALWAAQADA